MTDCEGAKERAGIGRALALAALVMLGGCSWVPNAVNPIEWYRNLSGASKNDALDQNQPNQKNLDAGSKEPYPNLASVPDVPDQALSTIDRDKLQQSLVADRENAEYSAERLEAGVPAPGTAPSPPPPGAPAAAAKPEPAVPALRPSAAPPQESSLQSPTVPNLPTGETPPPAPPPPKIAPSAVAVAPPPPVPVETASLEPGRRRAPPSASVAVAAIDFAAGSSTLSDAARNQLSTIAAMQHRQGGTLRIIGHAKPPPHSAAMQQKLTTFDLALARARAVAQELAAEGVPAAAVAVEAAPSREDDKAATTAEIFLEH